MGVNIWEGSKAERVAVALEGLLGPSGRKQTRVSPLSKNPFVTGVVEIVGIPDYINDVSEYEAYNLTEKGWYIFARITPMDGSTVTQDTIVTGAAGYILNTAENCVDVAIKFEVAAMTCRVQIVWGDTSDTIYFKATDLAIRNLDYRSTFYIYDISRFVTWTFAPNTAAVFASGKKYYTETDGEYTLAEVTAGNPAIYYEQGITYALTADTTFQDGKTYYTKDGDNYIAAEVTVGDTVTADTYYEQTYTYTQTEDTEFVDGKTYYTSDGTTYTEAVVTAGDPITVYYVHSKLHLEGMTRNVTYRLDEIVDAPIEIVLPVVPDDGYGCWYEIQMRFDASYSITLLPEAEGVKIGTATTQSQTAGINIVDLQYTDVDDVQMWTLLNTHSNIPTT